MRSNQTIKFEQKPSQSFIITTPISNPISILIIIIIIIIITTTAIISFNENQKKKKQSTN